MTKERAARAGAWSALDIVLRQGVQFVVAVILARLLSPADFGLMSLLAFFSSLSIVFVQGGLSMALVQRTETSHAQESAVFWVNVVAGTLFALILLAIAPMVARFYGYPLMDPLMYVVAGQVVLSSLGAVHSSLLTRSLRFDRLTKAGVVTSLVSGVAGVVAAVMGWGVWALAIQFLVNAAVGSATLWWVSDWRPAWRADVREIRDLFGFGARISLSSTLEILYGKGFALVIGKAYGASDLGLLERASNTTGLPTGIISQIIARTALPLFAARSGDIDGLRRGFQRSVSLAMLLSLPLMAGLALLSELVILNLFGPKWGGSAPLLAITAIGGTLVPLHVLNLQLLLALGDSKRFLQLEIQKKAIGVFIFGAGCFFGIAGVAYASILFAVVAYIINARPTRESINYGIVAQIGDLRGIIAATLFMSAGVLVLKSALALPPLPALAVLVAVGGVLYMGFGFALRLRAFREGLDTVLMLVRRP
jgi:teichuronic acid exporter